MPVPAKLRIGNVNVKGERHPSASDNPATALLANFPVPSGGTRQSFTSSRDVGACQERALYAVGGTVDSVTATFSQQITGAGWTPTVNAAQGSVGASNYQITQDYVTGSSKAHVLVTIDAKLGTTLSTTITTIFRGNAPSLSTGITAEPSSGATKSASDQGAADPAGFPRLPGSVRASYELASSPQSRRESAAYALTGTVDSAEAFYARALPVANWTEVSRYVSIDDVHQMQKTEFRWQTAGRKAAVTLTSAAAGGGSARITVTTDGSLSLAAGSPRSTSPAAIVAQPPAAAAALGISAPGIGAAPLANANGVRTTPAPSLGVQAPGVSAIPAGTPKTSAGPVSSLAAKAVAPITGISGSSLDPVQHQVAWQCATGEDVCISAQNKDTGSQQVPTNSYAYAVAFKGPSDTAFTPLGPQPAVVSAGSCAGNQTANGGSCAAATGYYAFIKLTTFLSPQTTIRVTRQDPSGPYAQQYADYVFASPPQPQEPAGFTASEPTFGQVSLSWQAVPHAVDYRISEKGSTAPPARIAGTSTTINSVTAGSHTYQVATEYVAGTPAYALPEATVAVHGVPPAHSVPFLSRRGVGTAATASLHATRYLGFASADLNHDSWDGPGSAGGTAPVTISGRFGLVQGWDGVGETPQFVAPTAAARYANVTELGLGRTVMCWQWPNRVTPGPVDVGFITLCIAGSHGVPSGPHTPDGGALYQSATAGPESIGVIVTSPTLGQFFAHLVPDPSDSVGTHDPISTSDNMWGAGWKLSMTTILDTEGPKYTPHACMACHGGTFDATTGSVTGASLLPIDPGLVVFGSQPGSDRAASEEGVRTLNAIIAASNPAPAVANYIDGLYNGQVANAGSVAQADYVPAGWSQQSDVFRMVVKRDCVMCHLTAPTGLTFDSWAGFTQYKAAIKVDVCSGHSMPNAEVPYNNFWSATAAIGSATLNLGGYMLATLGFTTCP